MDIQTEKELKPIPLWSQIVCWPIGVFFSLLGAFAILENGDVTLGLASLAIGCLLIPPIRLLMAEKTGNELPIWARGLLIFALLSLIGILGSYSSDYTRRHRT